MNIAQIINANTSSLTNSQTSSQATTSASPVSQAMQKAEARIQAQLDTTSAQLSSFGKLKSAVSDAQLAAKALSGLTTASSTADVKAAANSFLTSFNAAIKTAKTTAAVPGGSAAEASGAARVTTDLSRAISSTPAAMDALRKIGFKQLSDGTLTLDASKFDAAQKADPTAVQSALAKVGQLVDATATKELATGGKVSDSMASLGQRATALKSQQTAILTMVQKLSPATSTTNTGYVGYGLSAYQST